MLNNEYLTLIKVIGRAVSKLFRAGKKAAKRVPVDKIIDGVEIANQEEDETSWDDSDHFK